MFMERLIKKCNNLNYDWFEIVSEFGKLGNAIKLKNKTVINEKMLALITILLKIADENDIDMNEAWHRWITKALSKHYD